MYFGIENGIKIALSEISSFPDKLRLDFNIDGLPIHKSTNKSFWPILITLVSSLVLNSDYNKICK